MALNLLPPPWWGRVGVGGRTQVNQGQSPPPRPSPAGGEGARTTWAIPYQRGTMKTVLFLCTGNYYRSRFAEVVFNTLAGRAGLPWRAESRGLALELGVNNVGPLSAHA